LHEAYVEAGSQIILTNTFGGNRIKLGKAGYVDRTRELNIAGAALARQAAGGRAFVAGDIGPTGELMEPLGPLGYEEALEVFSEQAAALVEGGVDAIWVETMADLDEARAAVAAASQITGRPIFCSLSFGKKGRTMMGVSGKMAAEALAPLGLAAIGANCGEGLDVVETALSQMREVVPGVPLIAKPNAGLPRIVDGRVEYDTDPHDFAERTADFLSMGVKIIGSCCGSSPEYIAEIKKKLK
jgi:5-methyltetrahydrofolate--homocysteine methyltransferase